MAVSLKPDRSFVAVFADYTPGTAYFFSMFFDISLICYTGPHMGSGYESSHTGLSLPVWKTLFFHPPFSAFFEFIRHNIKVHPGVFCESKSSGKFSAPLARDGRCQRKIDQSL